MSFIAVDESRYNLSSNISKKEINKLLKLERLSVIQFNEPVENSTWKNIESILLSNRPEIEVRVFGFHGKVCNLDFVELIPSVENFSADCLQNAVNHEKITSLKKLKTLSLGIYNLESFEFLNEISSKVENLYLSSTKSKKPNISSISKFTELKHLFIEGHNKGIEEISKLKKLESLVLRSISTKNLDFLVGLENLWSVDIKLGGIKSFEALTQIPNLKYLELWQVRMLDNIDFISQLYNLQYLFLQSLPNIEKLPSFVDNDKLRRIRFENLKGLRNIDSLEFVPHLEEFSFSDCSNFQPEELIPVLKNINLKYVRAGFGSDKRNDRFMELIKEYNKIEFNLKPFKFK